MGVTTLNIIRLVAGNPYNEGAVKVEQRLETLGSVMLSRQVLLPSRIQTIPNYLREF